MPITITIEGANVDEVRQLVQDLAETITGMRPEEIPVDTKVSTLEQRPAGQAAPAAPQTGATSPPAQAPVAPSSSAAPATPTNGAQPNGQPGGQARPPASAPTAPTAPPVAAPPAASPAQPASSAPAAPTSVPEYTFHQIASATMQLQEAGHNVFEIFQQFGVQFLNQLPKERYAEYAAVLRQRGAKI